MSEELLQKLIDTVLNTAPELWRIGMRQVITSGIRYIISSVFWLVLVIGSLKYLSILKSKKEKVDYGDETLYDIGMIGLGCLIGCGVVVIVILLDFALAYFFNPEYYTIKVLMDLVK